MSEERTLITGAALFDGERLSEPGAVLCEGRRIVAVGDEALGADGAGRQDHPGCLLAPRFVNAHSHLALTHLRGRLEFPGTFPGWLRRLIPHLSASGEQYASSVAAGAEECHASGTGLVADVLFFSEAVPAHLTVPLDTVVFLEFAGLNDGEWPSALDGARRLLDEYGDRLQFGIAPHAPYSTGAAAYEAAAELARERGLLISTHISESPEELQLLESGKGPFAWLMRARWLSSGTWWRAPKCSPVRWLADLGVLGPDLLAVHANYVSDEDIGLLAEAGATVVYCPRSHRYFQHPTHPLPRLLEAGVRVVLGTDSVASNESLEMHEELKLVRERFPELAAEAIWRLGTQAAVLGREGLEEVVVVRLGEGEGDVLERALGGEARVAQAPHGRDAGATRHRG